MRLLSLACVILIIGATQSRAESSLTDILEALDGKFRGKGQALVMQISASSQQIRCSLNNHYEEADNVLVVSGACATSMGKMNIDGELRMEGGEIRGAFLSPVSNARSQETEAAMDNGVLVLTTKFSDTESGEVGQVRQLVDVAFEDKFAVQFQQFHHETGVFRDAGELEFRRVGQ